MRVYRKGMMKRGLLIKLIWRDNDIVEARVSASNGEFAGTADMYLSYGALKELAEGLRSFPTASADARDVEIGDLDNNGSGGATVRLYMVDRAGHMAITLTLLAGTLRGTGQIVTMHSAIEAAAVDDFVSELMRMNDEVGTHAFLRFSL
ncbi:hypothetical protein JAO29_01040 [Edaphobacter sp. HDX4]|uniref:hypothetical protein n=1 Tax=Edaphobacter sp. HDX4 TaxID=2794064 RepID=UPI002FE61EA9